MDDAVEDPRSGQRWVFRPRREDLLEADLYVSRGGYVRSHMHPEQEETFTGISGTFTLDVAGESRRIGPGDTVVVPPGTPHGFADAADDAHVLVAVRPALELESYFRASSDARATVGSGCRCGAFPARFSSSRSS